jgi:hypothetical protein
MSKTNSSDVVTDLKNFRSLFQACADKHASIRQMASDELSACLQSKEEPKQRLNEWANEGDA